MPRIFPILLPLLMLAVFSFAQESSLPTAKLGWRNGDTLEGKILPSSGDKLSWKSDAFVNAFRIDPAQLKSIEFPKSYLKGKPKPSSQFRITFSNGDRLFGDLIEIGPDTVTFKCPRFSENIVVKRSYLDRIERMNNNQLKYSGPIELDNWKELGRSDKDPEYWFAQKTGEFATHRWGGELFRTIAMPTKVEIAFSVVCPGERPNIEIGVTEDPQAGPRIETWDDTLVLTSENRFSPILKMSEKTQKLDLRIFWDQDKKTIKVCSANGEIMAELDKVDFQTKTKPITKVVRRRDSANRNPNEFGFRLLNRTAGVKLSRLVVRDWDGKNIARYDATKPRIELDGGNNILFDLNELQLDRSAGLRIKGRQLPLSKVDQMVFSTNSRTTAEAPLSRLSWYDGGIITGELAAINYDTVQVNPSWLEKEFTAELKDAKALFFPESDAPVIEPGDIIKSGALNLGGALTPGNQGSSNTLLSWRPIGSENASPLADTRKVDITREAYPGATEVVGDARIYLINDEVIAGKLISINDEEVEFSSYLTGQVKIPYSKVRAVDIEGAGLIPNGFIDKGWEILPPADAEEEEEQQVEPTDIIEEDEDDEAAKEIKDVTMTDDQVVLRKGGFGHMNLLVGDRIRFHTKWESNYGVFTLRLFCSDFSRESPSTDLLIGAQGSRILVGQLKPGGGFNFNGQQVSIKDQEADIEIMARHDKIEVSVNGKLSLSMDVKPEQVSGNGIVILTGGGWRGWNDNPNNIEFSNFSVDRSPGFLPKRIINQSAKKHALTVPRFHQEDPPTHVLVASNGDLLRGKLKSASGEKIIFESRETEITLSKSRVAAIVWLLPAREESEAEPPPESTESESNFLVTHQFVLHDGTRLNLAAENIEPKEEMFIGRSEILGVCKVPIQSMRNVKQGPAHRLGRTASSDQLAYSDWVIENTPKPAIPKGDGSEASPMIGKEAPDFILPLLDGGEFKLSSRKGRVVVLDFWATWCGPCIRAMPEVFRALGAFRGKPVDFCAVNQAETAPIINEFLENRGWTGTTVGLDFQLSTGRDYEVKGIPHTVVIGKDGKIAWVHTGHAPDLNKKLVQAISKALQKK